MDDFIHTLCWLNLFFYRFHTHCVDDAYTSSKVLNEISLLSMNISINIYIINIYIYSDHEDNCVGSIIIYSSIWHYFIVDTKYK